MMLFRAGLYLVLGESRNFHQGVHTVGTRYALVSGRWCPMIFEDLDIPESLVIDDNYPEKESMAEGRRIYALQNLLAEVALRFSEIRESIGTSLLSVGERIALEGVRPTLRNRGLIEGLSRLPSKDPFTTSKSFFVYMKENPFRDITRINEGTDVMVIGYSRGCAVIEADGERFWLPVEEGPYFPGQKKDDEYYFRHDADEDGIPDPLEFLPSKPGFSGRPSDPEDNHNAQPDLRKVAGNFAAVPYLRADDNNYLGESAIFYNYYVEYGPSVNKILDGDDIDEVLDSLLP